jgi:hypothetical protein
VHRSCERKFVGASGYAFALLEVGMVATCGGKVYFPMTLFRACASRDVDSCCRLQTGGVENGGLNCSTISAVVLVKAQEGLKKDGLRPAAAN